MNKRNVLHLKNFIELEDRLRFDMSTSAVVGQKTEENRCGTAGCIAGFAAALWPEARSKLPHMNQRNEEVFWFSDKAVAAKLDLSDAELHRLCYDCPDMEGNEIKLGDVTREAALDALQRLVDTGVIEFDRDLCDA